MKNKMSQLCFDFIRMPPELETNFAQFRVSFWICS